MLEIAQFVWIAILVVLAVLVVLAMLGYIPYIVMFLREVFDIVKTPFRKRPGIVRFRTATVTQEFQPGSLDSRATGKVEADGAIWSAECPSEDAAKLAVGDTVEVETMDGLTLIVRSR